MAEDSSGPPFLSRNGEKLVLVLIVGPLVILLVLTIIMMLVRLDNLRLVHEDRPAISATADAEISPEQQALFAAETARAEAEQAIRSADDAVNTVQMILSFLEGAAVLAGVSLGAAAYFGFRNAKDLRQELNEEIGKLKERHTEIKNLLENLQAYRQPLDNLQPTLDEFKTLSSQVEDSLEDIQPIFADLLQAGQELRLHNHQEAYKIALRVLERDPNNPQALYIAGWLAIQYVPGKLDQAIEYLKKIDKNAEDKWPTAKAAYGVALRRKAKQASKEHRMEQMRRAQDILEDALSGDRHHLVDLNLESFWGPVAGTWRDMAECDPKHRAYYLEKAVEAYQEALKVTPRSAYPIGNLASLYLEQGKLDDALEAFERTLDFARAELATFPNDYYHLMDIAMAGAVVLRTVSPELRAHHAAETRDALADALTMDVTCEMLQISLGGWGRIYQNCPSDWADVKAALDEAITMIERKMNELHCSRAGNATPDEVDSA